MRAFDHKRDFLVGLQAVVVVVIVAASVLSARLLAPLESAADDIAFNAAPSVDELAAARAESRLALLRLARFATLESSRTTGAVEAVEAPLRTLDARLALYLATPAFPGEVEHWDALRKAQADFEASVRAMIRAGLAAPEARLSYDAVEKLGTRFSDEATGLIQLNLDHAKTRANRIGEIRARATRIGFVLDGLVLSLVVVTALVANRLHKARIALEATRTAQSEERAKELDLFAARVAHDIRSPLQATTLTLSSLRRPASSPEQLAKLVDRCERGVRRVLTLTDDLLAFARSSTRTSGDERASLVSVLTDVVSELTPLAEAAKISILVEPLPEVTVRCSGGVLTSTFSNLVRNAITHMDASAERTVAIRGVRAGPTRVRVEVEDSGPGVPAAQRSEIFDLYVRGTTTAPGFGLGLATAKRLVESHGGSIGLRPSTSGGSVFWFELPTTSQAA